MVNPPKGRTMIEMKPLTLFELLYLLSSLLSAGAVAFALLFFARQASQLRQQTANQLKALTSASWGSIVPIMLDINKIYVDDPTLYPYFYFNEAVPAGLTRQKVLALAEMHIDLFDYVVTNLDQLPEVWNWSRRFWEAWIIDTFTSSQILRDYFDDVKDWYPARLTALWQDAC